MNKNMSSIRQTFLNFFCQKQHNIIQSSSLIPIDDSSLLFTNAGMNQFKNIFLGKEIIKYKRVVTSQRCIRAGGKHNDLENVGYSENHHTFFEMLGNFSFGDYFKEKAINFAWELLTSHNWFNISKERLLVTIHHSDDESFNIWKKIGVPTEKIIRIGSDKVKIFDSDNFWQMGDTGPCGPCTEIFYIKNVSKNISKYFFKEKNKFYVEIWNIVFIQYNKQLNGNMFPLETPSVDTGMGLERIASILQNVNSTYEIDLFVKLIKKISEVINVKFNLQNHSLKVISDHIRAAVYLISDGVLPNNTDRGYVLRRIIRRAIRHGYILGVKKIFFYKLVPILINIMNCTKNIYIKQDFIQKILYTEENQFQNTLKKGLNILNKEINRLNSDTLDGSTVFRLYDTFGLPLDVIEDVCKEHHLKVDKKNFELELIQQKSRSKNNKFKIEYNDIIDNQILTKFEGFNKLKIKSKIIFILIDNTSSKKIITKNQQGIIILEKTTFYGESGGQNGDQGFLSLYKNKFLVLNTKKCGNAILHFGTVISGKFELGNIINVCVDKQYRFNTSQNHSSIHLLNSALEIVLKTSVEQKGSFVNNKYARLDFSYFEKIDFNKIKKIEKIVNDQIRKNLIIKDIFLPLEKAKISGVKYLSNEKYEKNVRVLKIGNFSKELCCGTHVKRTGEIGIFQILSESSISKGIRRIELITGENALCKVQSNNYQINNVSSLLRITDNDIYKKVIFLIDNIKNLKLELKEVKNKYAIEKTLLLKKNIIKIKNVNVLIHKIHYVDKKIIRLIVINLKKLLKSAIIIIYVIHNKKIFIVAGVTDNLIKYVQADFLIKLINKKIQGNGGGNSYIAQGNGKNILLIDKALNYIKSFIIKKLENVIISIT